MRTTPTPRTRYAKSGDLNIAYQVVGDGPRDLVYVPGWISNVEVSWDHPSLANALEGMASFSRLIVFDKRGVGMSDSVPVDKLPTLEERMDDVRAVMDAAGSESATIMGHSEGGPMSMLFAATYPERTDRLVLSATYAKRIRSDDYPWAPTRSEREAETRAVEATWGEPDHMPDWLAPSMAKDRRFRDWFARYSRLSASPRAAAALMAMNSQIDVRAILPTLRVPTLCIYRVGDQDVDIEEGRWIASKIPGARLVELPGDDHAFWTGDTEAILSEVEEFVTGHRPAPRSERVLATVLFTDIVGSTERAAQMGDAEWRRLLAQHNDIVRTELARFRGREVNTAGDGFIATFDGPVRAIGAAHAICAAVEGVDLKVRTGLHTGEIELTGDDVAGLAVHIGARIAALALPGEVLVSRTVKDLTAGSGIDFEDRGLHTLKGVPDEWQLYAAV
jgi:pimeloyl-ACP methyl ester carboxylesterase